MSYVERSGVAAEAWYELGMSDRVAMRCFKQGIAYPDDWRRYDDELRDILAKPEGRELPQKPPYPAMEGGADAQAPDLPPPNPSSLPSPPNSPGTGGESVEEIGEAVGEAPPPASPPVFDAKYGEPIGGRPVPVDLETRLAEMAPAWIYDQEFKSDEKEPLAKAVPRIRQYLNVRKGEIRRMQEAGDKRPALDDEVALIDVRLGELAKLGELK